MGDFNTDSAIIDLIAPYMKIRDLYGAAAGIVSLPVTLPLGILYAGYTASRRALRKIRAEHKGHNNKTQNNLEDEILS